MTSEPGATAGTAHSVVREVRIGASPEIVWEFFVDPEKAQRWEGVKVEIDPRAGGALRVDMHGDRNIATGILVAVEPYSRLVFTWGWEGHPTVLPGSSTVEVTLTPDGDDTVVRLEHRDLPSTEEAANHGEGWSHYLARLTIAGAGGDPGPDPWAETPPGEE